MEFLSNQVHIEVVSNGYLLTTTTAVGYKYQIVFTSFEELVIKLKQLIEHS